MFCSNCGKTIPVGSTTCVHCKMEVGSGEFSAASYIASLPDTAVSPGEADVKPRYTPFTRTTYTTMEDDGSGSDALRRTSYRPVLGEEEGAESAPEEEGNAEGGGSAPEAEETARPAQEEKAPDVPQGDPDKLPESMRAQSFTPVKLPGISPQTQERMRRLAEMDEAGTARKPARPVVPSLFSASARGEKTRVPKRVVPAQDPETAPASAPEEEQAAPAAEAEPSREQEAAADSYYDEEEEVFDTSDIEEDEFEPERRSFLSFFRRGEREPLSRSASILRTALIAALVVAILVGGFIWLSLRTAAKSPVVGVTNSLFEKGVALIESHTTEQYRSRIISTYSQDATGTTALQMQLEDRAAITALLPGTPLANDQEFVDTLLSIQDQIDNAVTLDALASLTGTDLGGSSQERWSAIRNAITRLKGASTATDFASIAQSAVVSVTPTPAPSPTPSPYSTLTKGMKDSEEVRAMQNRLYELGWFNDVRDGDFGAVTQNAVKMFQQAVGLSVTGIADPETLAAMYAEDAPRTGNRITLPPTELPGGESGTAAPEPTDEPVAPASPN